MTKADTVAAKAISVHSKIANVTSGIGAILATARPAQIANSVEPDSADLARASTTVGK
jgi:hypothetical protein